MRFSKMNGIGNDYIYVNTDFERVDSPEALAVRLSDRHFSVGGDGLVLISRCKRADFAMRMFNPDGTESEMCGNAIRCVGKYVFDRGLIDKTDITVSTGAGIKRLNLTVNDGEVSSVRVNMGVPIFEASKVPVFGEEKYFIERTISTARGDACVSCVSVGNPHAIIFIDSLADVDMRLAEEISTHRCFPERTNVEFALVADRENVFVRVYERGTGETLACGTGATAVFAVARHLNKVGEKVSVHLKGGDLLLEESDGELYMTGQAELNFDGIINI